jgi:hypothetical protein
VSSSARRRRVRARGAARATPVVSWARPGAPPEGAVLAGLGQHGVGVIAIAELHRRLADDRHEVLRAKARIEPQDVPRVGLLDRELPHRAALDVVGREEPRTGLAAQHGRQLPGQVVGIVHAAITAEAAGRRHDVGRVARQEHASLPKALGPVRHRAPALHALDLDGQVRCAEGAANVLDAALLAHVLARARAAEPGLVDRRVDDQEARVAREREAEEALQARVEHVDHAEVAVAEQRVDVGAEVDRDAVGKRPVTHHGDPQLLTRRTLGTIGGDRVASPHASLGASVACAQMHGHSGVVLLERHRLGAVLEAGTRGLGVPADDGLEPDLRDEEAGRRAQVLDPLVDRAEIPVELLAA